MFAQNEEHNTHLRIRWENELSIFALLNLSTISYEAKMVTNILCIDLGHLNN